MFQERYETRGRKDSAQRYGRLVNFIPRLLLWIVPSEVGAEGGIVSEGLLKSLKTWAIPFSCRIRTVLVSQCYLSLVSPVQADLPLFLTL